ncbi:hypothetical protein KSS87_001150 [Heliosperma pusillum]|nr:hypothetical protein KSS87_001150 [Heliosperma pusillum]
MLNQEMRLRQTASVVTKTEIDVPRTFEGNVKKSTTSDGSWKRIFWICLGVRMVNSLLVQTYFNPDEHWQSLEVAHRLVFGYGHLTWEWEKGIRSYLHPLLFAILYKILASLHLDNPLFMMKAPRLLQAFFAAICDLYLYRYSDIIFGNQFVLGISIIFYHSALLYTVMSQCTLPFMVYLDTIVGGKKRENHWTVVLGITSLLDRLMYGSWIIVPFNFLRFNFFSSGGDYYGTHPWHWYLTQGFPVMLFTFLPFSVAGIIYSKHWKLSGLIGWVIGVYSILGHKEFRFIFPVLPVALMFAGYSLASLRKLSLPIGKGKRISSAHSWLPSKLRLSVFFLLATNIPMGLYMSLVHQRGTEDVMHYLSKEAQNGEVRGVLFLTPCHATPYYSALHQNLPMRFLDCTPRFEQLHFGHDFLLKGSVFFALTAILRNERTYFSLLFITSEQSGVLDESDRFMLDPFAFTSDFARNWSLPSHIVMFDSEETKLKGLLISLNFREVKRFFHAQFKVDRDLQAAVVVYAYMGW